MGSNTCRFQDVPCYSISRIDPRRYSRHASLVPDFRGLSVRSKGGFGLASLKIALLNSPWLRVSAFSRGCQTNTPLCLWLPAGGQARTQLSLRGVPFHSRGLMAEKKMAGVFADKLIRCDTLVLSRENRFSAFEAFATGPLSNAYFSRHFRLCISFLFRSIFNEPPHDPCNRVMTIRRELFLTLWETTLENCCRLFLTDVSNKFYLLFIPMFIVIVTILALELLNAFCAII